MLQRTLAVAIAAGMAANTAAAADRLAVSWNEGGAGRVALMETESPWALNSALTIGADSTLRYIQGKLYAVSAAANTVTVIDPAAWTIDMVFNVQSPTALRDIA